LTAYAYMQPVAPGVWVSDPAYYVPVLLPALISGAMTWVVYDDALWWRAARRAARLVAGYSCGVLRFSKPVSGSTGALLFDCGPGSCSEEFVEYGGFEGVEARLPREAFAEMELRACRGGVRGVLPAARIRVKGVDVYLAVVDESMTGRRRISSSRGSGGVAVVESVDGNLMVRAWPSGGGAVLRYECGGRSLAARVEEPVSIEYPASEPLILVAARGSLTYRRLVRALGGCPCLAGKALEDCKPEITAA